nr:hypothetical protein Iba_chr12aCG18780 [Ipomoea batatas]
MTNRIRSPTTPAAGTRPNSRSNNKNLPPRPASPRNFYALLSPPQPARTNRIMRLGQSHAADLAVPWGPRSDSGVTSELRVVRTHVRGWPRRSSSSGKLPRLDRRAGFCRPTPIPGGSLQGSGVRKGRKLTCRRSSLGGRHIGGAEEMPATPRVRGAEEVRGRACRGQPSTRGELCDGHRRTNTKLDGRGMVFTLSLSGFKKRIGGYAVLLLLI